MMNALYKQDHTNKKMKLISWKISYRSSKSVWIIDEDLIPEKYREKVIKENILKKEILLDLKRWETIHGVELLEKQNLQLK